MVLYNYFVVGVNLISFLLSPICHLANQAKAVWLNWVRIHEIVFLRVIHLVHYFEAVRFLNSRQQKIYI